MKNALWENVRYGADDYILMNLSHPVVDTRVMAEMDAGVDVYYDRRWGATEIFTNWLAEHPELIREKNVLILGAGVGSETLVLGQYCSHVWLNDLAPTAVALCSEQMSQNGFTNFTPLVGRYEEVALPEVDLVVGSFLVYNDETYQAMEAFMQSQKAEFILMNERLDPFPRFLTDHPHEILFERDGAVGVYFQKK